MLVSFARWLIVSCCLCAAWAPSAHAYSTPDAFITNPVSGGGGGRWFSGSPADGFGCSVCHTGDASARFPLLVSGLALDGYEPNTLREIVLSWPEFSQRWKELRPNAMAPADPAAPAPAMGLIAELVAESGKASGTVEIRTKTAGSLERCETSRPDLMPRVAARLYQVRPGVAPIQIKADRNGVMRCESRQLGQRCLIAVSSCGAEQTRIVWKAPPSVEGPIWFSAGFVATDALSGEPTGDFVTELAMPMVQQGSSSTQYEASLRNACSVNHVGRTGAHDSAIFGWLGVIASVVIVSRRRRDLRMLVGAMLAIAWAGCGIEPVDHDPAMYPNAGLYTPGSVIGASDPTDVPDPAIVYSERCVSPNTGGGTNTEGELTVEYTTQTVGQRYAPRNISAVWIETMDEQFVANLEVAAGLRRPGLVYWQERACTEPTRLGPDVVTSATKKTHDDAHEATWTGVDLNNVAVADGEYQLLIEVTETDKEPGEFQAFPFTKGPTAFDRDESPAIGGLATLHVTWMPMP